jgi:hypothetical protein
MLTTVVAGSNPVMPDTKTGTELLVVRPLPNSPAPFLPQHLAVPFAITAHEWKKSAVMLTAVVPGVNPFMPETKTGTRLSTFELLPNSPS